MDLLRNVRADKKTIPIAPRMIFGFFGIFGEIRRTSIGSVKAHLERPMRTALEAVFDIFFWIANPNKESDQKPFQATDIRWPFSRRLNPNRSAGAAERRKVLQAPFLDY